VGYKIKYSWLPVPEGPYSPLYEVVEFKHSIEPFEVYRGRYVRPEDELPPTTPATTERNINEILSGLEKGSTVLSLGAGHSYFCNCLVKKYPSMKVTSLDIVEEASIGLVKEVDFLKVDILKEDIPGKYDYVFCSHTMEHFTRDEIFNEILPKVVDITMKAFIVLVPYADSWAGEPNHKSRFYENDEFAALSSRYKMLGEHEIAYWIEVNNYGNR